MLHKGSEKKSEKSSSVGLINQAEELKTERFLLISLKTQLHINISPMFRKRIRLRG